MRPFVVIRKCLRNDDLNVQNVIRDYIQSQFKSAFFFILFREITLQLIVLSWAILFIFVGVPLFMCFVSIPIVIALIFFCVYGSYFNKATELANANPKICWVAEVYEPFILRTNTMEIEYDFPEEKEIYDNPDLKKYKKKIIGTIAAKNHNQMHNSCWLHRLAIQTGYPYNKIGYHLITTALNHAYENNLYSCETVTTECHEDFRELLLKMGFTIRQIYHKQIVGNSLRVMKAQMGIDLENWMERQKNGETLNKEVY